MKKNKSNLIYLLRAAENLIFKAVRFLVVATTLIIVISFQNCSMPTLESKNSLGDQNMDNGAPPAPTTPITDDLPSAQIDFIGPTVKFISTPSLILNVASGEVTFNSYDDDFLKFQCQVLQNTAFTDCLSPFRFSNLSDGDYFLRVKAVDKTGNFGDTIEHKWTVKIPVEDPEIPVKENAATLSWDANVESDISGYKIYYVVGSGTLINEIDAGFLQPNTLNRVSYKINNLTSSATYYFTVTAYDLSGNESDKSLEVEKVIP